MEMQATDYFSGDESALFGNSTKESDEETGKDDDEATEMGIKYKVMTTLLLM